MVTEFRRHSAKRRLRGFGGRLRRGGVLGGAPSGRWLSWVWLRVWWLRVWAVVKEEEVSRPVVKMPSYEKGGEKRRRVGESTEDEEEVKMVRELIAPVGPRARYRSLMRKVKGVLEVKEAGPRFAAGRDSNHALSGVSGGTDAWRQSPGGSGGYGLRPRIGGNVYRGFGGRGRGRGVYFG